MGRHDKRARTLKRHPASRTVGRTVLIVCEDSKSSPSYFIQFRKELKLSSVQVEVCGKECGSAPKSVVDFAIEKKQSVKAGNIFDEYDYIFCVIDVDRHPSLNQAIDKAKGKKIDVILSNPCFEYWYILHFDRDGSPCHDSKEVLSRLNGHLRKKHFPDYDKGKADIFETIYPLTDTAIKNSKDILHSQHNDEKDLRNCNPATYVHRLVEYLREMAKEQDS